MHGGAFDSIGKSAFGGDFVRVTVEKVSQPRTDMRAFGCTFENG
jgi:hypothetical protein